MKKHSFKRLPKTIVNTVLAVFLAVNTNAAEIPARSPFPESTASVKFISADSDSYVFNVSYTNESNEKFLLEIKDEEDNTLFTEIYTDKQFEKRFRLMKDVVNSKLNFIIKNLRNNSVQAFQVATTSRIVEDVAVKKING